MNVDVGNGLTVTVYETGKPTHPPSVGVTVIVEVIGTPEVFVVLKIGTTLKKLSLSQASKTKSRVWTTAE